MLSNFFYLTNYFYLDPTTPGTSGNAEGQEDAKEILPGKGNN